MRELIQGLSIAVTAGVSAAVLKEIVVSAPFFLLQLVQPNLLLGDRARIAANGFHGHHRALLCSAHPFVHDSTRGKEHERTDRAPRGSQGIHECRTTSTIVAPPGGVRQATHIPTVAEYEAKRGK